jgi:hypothetical protein
MAPIVKNGNATTFPLGAMTKTLIGHIPHLGPLLFPARGHHDKPFIGFGVSKLTLDRSGVKNFTHHTSGAPSRDDQRDAGRRAILPPPIWRSLHGKISLGNSAKGEVL